METQSEQEVKDFKKRAEEAALWMLEREVNPPTMEQHGDTLRFEAGGLQFEYRPRGWHFEDNPWRKTNLRKVTHDEGLVVIATCPRHGGVRRTERIIPVRLSPRADINEILVRTRRALAEAKSWAENVECDKCVASMYSTTGGFVTTHARLVRTYERNASKA